MASANEDSKLFHVPASDTRGHSVKKSFRITPQLEMQIEILLGSKKFPYRTEGELFRHALVSHLRGLDKTTPLTNSLMPQIISMIEVTRMEEENREFTEVVEMVVKEINNLVVSGNEARAKELMDKVLVEAERMPDEYWRKRYKEELGSRLSSVFKGGNKDGTVHSGNNTSGTNMGGNKNVPSNPVREIIRMGLRPAMFTAGEENDN